MMSARKQEAGGRRCVEMRCHVSYQSFVALPFYDIVTDCSFSFAEYALCCTVLELLGEHVTVNSYILSKSFSVVVVINVAVLQYKLQYMDAKPLFSPPRSCSGLMIEFQLWTLKAVEYSGPRRGSSHLVLFDELHVIGNWESSESVVSIR